MKPLTMLEFVLESNDLESIKNYAKFLSQKPEKWMFVPCDDDGNVLEEPKGEKCCAGIQNDCGCGGHLQYDDEYMHQYKQAIERVIFDGFEIFGNTLYIPNLISIKLDKEGKTTDFENLDKLISEFPEYLTLKKPIK